MYKVPDQSRYEEFRAHPVEQLESEAALLRVCIEKAMLENRPSLVSVAKCVLRLNLRGSA